MLYAGLDLSRKRLDFHLLDDEGATVEVGSAPPDAAGLPGLAERLGRHGAPIRAAIEPMNGARFVHPTRARWLAGGDRRCAEGEGSGAAGVQDRPDRCLVLADLARPRSRARDLAAQSALQLQTRNRDAARDASALSTSATSRGHKTDTSETTRATSCDASLARRSADLQEKLCGG